LIVSYGVALCCIALATALRFSLATVLGPGVPFLFFFPAVVLSAWYGGRGPGIFTAAAGTLSAWYWFVPPQGSFQVAEPPYALQLIAFFLVASFITVIIDRLHRARVRLLVTLSSIGDAVIVTDVQGRVTLMNPVAEALTGWGKEAMGKPLEQVLHLVNELTRERVQSPAAAVLARGGIVGLTNHTVLIAKDGTERPIDDSAAPVKDVAGDLVGVVMVFRDITLRRRGETTLARLAAIVESSEDAIMGKDLDGIITDWNAGAERMLGYSTSEMLGKNITMVVPTEYVDEERAILAKVARGDRVEHFETVRMDKRGRRVPISLSVSPIKNKSGDVVGASSIARSIAARKQAEERFRLAVEAAPNAMVMVDKHGRVLLANAQAERLFGYTREQWVGLACEQLVPERFREDHPGHRERFSSDPKARPMGAGRDLFGIRKDGTEIPVEIGLNPIEIDGETVILCAIADITERKRAEDERKRLLEQEHEMRSRAEEANRLKDEFLATVSHELRAPLNAVLGWASMLRRGGLDEEKTTLAIDTIQRNAKTQVQIIEDLLDASRIITGKLRLDVHPIMVATVVESAITSVRPMADTKGIRLHALLDPNAGPVSGDSTRLQQVVWNLLTNAIKFTPNGGLVQVRTERINSHIEIIVSDTGQGISAAFMPYVFDRFRQAEGGTTRQHGGLGLGLAIVRYLVELHGGSVMVDSPGEGKGATFTVRLPLAISHRSIAEKGVHPRVETRDALPLEALPNLEGVKVLVIDDELDTRSVLRTVLERCGAEVHDAGTAEQGLEESKRWRPSVIVSDVGMPGEDGYAFIKKYREWEKGSGSWTPAVALTAYARGEDRVRALSAGFQMHIAKPIEVVEFALVVAGLLGRGRQKLSDSTQG
jgi:PAS domain S-box-containing protein